MDSYWLSVENLKVQIRQEEILKNISFQIKAGEQWAFFGVAGSGKTLLAHALAGRHSFQGRVRFQGREEIPLEKTVLVVEQQHRFRDLRNQADFYYQQRYNSFDAEATITVREDLNRFEENESGVLSKSELLDRFHLTPLLDEPLIQLSNGENKRLQILKAVLQVPHLLILDEPFMGLDMEGRELLDGIIKKLSESGQQMVLLSSRDHLPQTFNRLAWLKNGHMEFAQKTAEPGSNRVPTGFIKFPSAIHFPHADFRYAVRMINIHVQYENKKILEGIHWEVEKGSQWALTGPNGAGKSTLLSLITADNPQAYANEIYLFDRRRGSGESIWDIKQKTGFLSPELHLYFEPSATAFTALASGLFDTIGLFRKLDQQQEALVDEWLKLLDCTLYAHRLLSGLPAGIQRLILLGRAMIKTAPLLILDEPCQGLDPAQTAFTQGLIDQYCRKYQATLIYTSHYPGDFPPGITQTLHLEKGKIC